MTVEDARERWDMIVVLREPLTTRNATGTTVVLV